MSGTPLGAAAGGADMLQEILRQKFTEAIQRQKLAEEIRQANMQNAVQQRQLGQGDQRIGLDRDALIQRGQQFQTEAGFKDRGLKLDEEMQPVRIKNIGAQTADIERKPVAEQAQRDFTLGRDKTQHGYQMQEIGAQGANALRIANVRHPDPAAPAGPTQKEVNEVNDALQVISQLRGDQALGTATGPFDARGLGIVRDPEGVTRVQALHNNLVDKMALAQAGKLKGQGQISNMEREMLKNAATTLNLKLGTPDYLTELAKVEAQFKRMLGPAAAAAPAPAAASGGSGFKVVEIK